MANEVFVDTSFVIALINDKDQYHAAAQKLADKYLRKNLITTDAILLEIGNALAKNFRMEAIETIKTLRNSPKTIVIEITGDLLENLFEKGFEIYEKYDDKDWGLVDCISFALMWQREISEVLTFDDDFKQAGFVILKD
jgi:hypothetical protein